MLEKAHAPEAALFIPIETQSDREWAAPAETEREFSQSLAVQAADVEMCGICLSSASNITRLQPFGDCFHRFCASCLQECERHAHVTCPVCRAPASLGRCRALRGTVPPPLNAAVPTPDSPRAATTRWERHVSALGPELRRHYGLSWNEAEVVFDSSVHGASLNSLRRKLLDASATLLVLMEPSGSAVGAFTAFPWRENSYWPYGNSGCFIFASTGYPGQPLTWHAPSHFRGSKAGLMVSKPSFVGFGGDGRPDQEDGFGLRVDDGLDRIASSRCRAFDNPGLGHHGRIARIVALAWDSEESSQGESLRFGNLAACQEARMLLGVAGIGRASADRDWFG